MHLQTRTYAYGSLDKIDYIVLQRKESWKNRFLYYADEDCSYKWTYYFDSINLFTVQEFLDNYMKVLQTLSPHEEFFFRFIKVPDYRTYPTEQDMLNKPRVINYEPLSDIIKFLTTYQTKQHSDTIDNTLLSEPKKIVYSDIYKHNEYSDSTHKYVSIWETYYADDEYYDDIYLSEIDIAYLSNYTEGESGIRMINFVKDDFKHLNPIKQKAVPKRKYKFINKISEYIIDEQTLVDYNTHVSPTSVYDVSIKTFFKDVLNTSLYNVKVTQTMLHAKWTSNDITTLNKITDDHLTYSTPYEHHNKLTNYDNMYTISFDMTLVHNKIISKDLNKFIKKLITTSPTIMSCVIIFDTRITLHIFPYEIDDTSYQNTPYIIGNKDFINNDKFKSKYIKELYQEWKRKNIGNLLHFKYELEAPMTWWQEDDTEISKHIHTPQPNRNIIYVGYHSVSNHIKIGRTVDWSNRFSLYQRLSPPDESINPIMTLRYYLYTPTTGDAVFDFYIMCCAEDFLKQITDESNFANRVVTKKNYPTEYYTFNSDLDEYIQFIHDKYMNLTLKELLSYRTKVRRTAFINKISNEINDKKFNVELFNEMIDSVDDTIKLKDYIDQKFTPELKDS